MDDDLRYVMETEDSPNDIREYLLNWYRHELVELILAMRWRIKGLEK